MVNKIKNKLTGTKKPTLNEIDTLRGIHANLRKLNNKFTFTQVALRGIISGVFTAIGATLIFGLLAALLYSTLIRVFDDQTINQFFEKIGIESTEDIINR